MVTITLTIKNFLESYIIYWHNFLQQSYVCRLINYILKKVQRLRNYMVIKNCIGLDLLFGLAEQITQSGELYIYDGRDNYSII
jgi:hypothetical protein